MRPLAQTSAQSPELLSNPSVCDQPYYNLDESSVPDKASGNNLTSRTHVAQIRRHLLFYNYFLLHPAVTRQMSKGKLLETMSWKEAESLLCEESVIVIPLGASAKEHGLHLQLQNDFLIAEYLKLEVLQRNDVVVLPTVN